jgi:hypothetical protein
MGCTQGKAAAPEAAPTSTGTQDAAAKPDAEALKAPFAAAEPAIADADPPAAPPSEEEAFKAVHSAVRWNKPANVIEALLESVPGGANSQDPKNGNFPLHIAAQNGHAETCKLLLSKGASVNAVNGKGNTGLHMAISYDYYVCIIVGLCSFMVFGSRP